MVASRFRIIIAIIATFRWFAITSGVWLTSCTILLTVSAYDSCPKQRVSNRIHRSQGGKLRYSEYFAETRQQPHQQQHRNQNFLQIPTHNDGVTSPTGTGVIRSERNVISSLLLALLISINAATAYAGDLPAIQNDNQNTEERSNVPTSIVSCSTSTGGTSNCVSTASVKQVDLFMLPWTWPESISGDEVVSRLKGVIASDQTLSIRILEKLPNTENVFFRIRAARNVCNDEIEILVNPNDRVITFRSQQVDGPDNVSDFGANRRRLEEIRKRLKVVTILGGGGDNTDYYRNGESTEGLTGQLKAFWGFQSGGGFESILLDEDE